MDQNLIDECFVKLNLKFDHLFDEVYIDFAKKINDFYKITRSPNFMSRIDLSEDIKEKFNNILPYKVSDCGIFRNAPKSFVQLHADTKRTFALNALLIDSNELFITNFFHKNNLIKVEYEKKAPILFNTKIPHCVYNNSPNIYRYVLTIGCIDESYDHVKEKFKDFII